MGNTVNANTVSFSENYPNHHMITFKRKSFDINEIRPNEVMSHDEVIKRLEYIEQWCNFWLLATKLVAEQLKNGGLVAENGGLVAENFIQQQEKVVNFAIF